MVKSDAYVCGSSGVEIEHYFIAYFDCVATFEAMCRTSVKGRAHMCSEAASMPDKSE